MATPAGREGGKPRKAECRRNSEAVAQLTGGVTMSGHLAPKVIYRLNQGYAGTAAAPFV